VGVRLLRRLETPRNDNLQAMFAKALKYFDWLFFAGAILLSLTGLLMIYSTGLSGTVERGLWVRQLVALSVGVGGLFLLSGLDYRFFRKNSSVLYLVAVALLLVVLLFGEDIRGSRRWFDFVFFNFQPAEFSKLALIVLLAKYFEMRHSLLPKFGFVLWSGLYVLVPAMLIALQPDLGSAMVHIAVWLGMLFVSAMPRRHFLYLLVGFLVLVALGWQFFFVEYQRDRIRSFMDPTADPLGRGYNVIQSIVAVGSGGWFGSGLARGLQSQLRFLPERQTDFIFASTAEELGFAGVSLVLALLGFLLFRMIKIQREARDLFGTYLASGIFFMIFTQSVVNIGMNLGFLPVTGITLPFLSYGGSSLLVNFLLLGIMQNIARNSIPVRFA